MADLAATRAALGNVLAQLTGPPALNVVPYSQANITPPAAIILPQPQAGFRQETFESGVRWQLRALLLCTYADDESSQNQLDAYLGTGSGSIFAVIKANERLGGVVDSCQYTGFQRYGLQDWSGQQYLGCQLMFDIMAT